MPYSAEFGDGRYLYELKPKAAGATAEQYGRLVDAVVAFGLRRNPAYKHTQAFIDASMTLELLEGAGLGVVDRTPEPEL